MYSSLEVRVPILDHRIIEYTLNLSNKLKIYNGTQKYILKEVLYEYIPKSLMERPKWGFGFPLAKWLKKDLKYLIDNFLSKEIIEKHNVFNFEIIENLKKRFFSGEDFLYNRLWSLIIFNIHFEH